MSTTSSLGRRPFGKPAKSVPEVLMLPTIARRFCAAKGTAGTAVLSRSISEGVTVAG
jgi:hypothetical protein